MRRLCSRPSGRFAINVIAVSPAVSEGEQRFAGGGPFIAEAVAPNSALADGGMNSAVAKALRGDEPPEPTAAATIYTAKKVVTMERNNPTATAVAVLGKRILAVGTLDQVKSALGTRPYTVNDALKSKVVMPGSLTWLPATSQPSDLLSPNAAVGARPIPNAHPVVRSTRPSCRPDL